MGARAGDEVAELYLRPAPDKPDAARRIAPGQPMPRLELAGFRRVTLAPRQSKTVTFTLTPDQLRLVNAQGERNLQPGTWQVYVGGRQPDLSRPSRLRRTDAVHARTTREHADKTWSGRTSAPERP